MGIFYTIPNKQLLQARNEIFVEKGISILKFNGFTKMPFSETLFGKNNLGDYTYEMCRLNEHSRLEAITTHISKGDSWIKIYLNIFELKPTLKSLDTLKNVNGMQFRLPPDSLTKQLSIK